ncbi:MAG: hypothetical protein JWN01_783 [Patescibacteria group bacterium]|nr:hypothetical protein [Patescibacteria group bacterium]
MLIYGILAEHYRLWGSGAALPLGGSIHGTLYIAYVIIVLATYSSLGWTRGRAIFGIMVSVVPYGTLVFEMWAAKKRQKIQLQSYRLVRVRAIIPQHDKILAVQPSSSPEWTLPGGAVLQGETAFEALRRILRETTGVVPEVTERPWLHEPDGQMELLFPIHNAKMYTTPSVLAALKAADLTDEAKFVARSEPELSRVLLAAFEQNKPR